MSRSISQLAREAGVSKMTVSRVLNGHPHVSSATRQKVEHVVRKHRFRVNLTARHLARGTRFNMAAVVVGLDQFLPSNFYHDLIVSIESAFKRRGHAIALFNIPCADDPMEPDSTLEMLAANYESRVLKGVILLGPPKRDARVAFLSDRGVRGLIVCGDSGTKGFGSIRTDNAEGIRTAVGHLAALGHRRFGFVGGPGDLSDARERAAAFHAAIRRLGIGIASDDTQTGGFTREGGRRVAEEWLHRGDGPPDSIVCANDDMAAGIYDVFAQRGVHIPGQVSITGFDGSSLAAHLAPPLTTVSQPIDAIGEAVADATTREAFDTRLRLAPSLTVGESVSGPRGQ